MPAQDNAAPLEITQLDDHTFRFTWHRTDIEAIDAWITHLMNRYHGARPSMTRNLHVFVTDRMPSVQTLMVRLRQLNTMLPDRPATRYAMVFPGEATTHVAASTLPLLARSTCQDEMAFFSADEIDQAYAWLMRDLREVQPQQ